jgi:PKD repeat protein
MKKKCMLSFCLVFCLALTFYGQRFQVTTGSANPEEKWAVVEDPAIGGYVTIGNDASTGISRLWISSYNANGTVATSAAASNNQRMIARDISIAPNHPINGIPTYYVTGWTEDITLAGIVNRMFVGRIDLTGTFMWYQENPIGPFGSVNDKEGVAIVTEPATQDAVVLGIVQWPGPGPVGSMVTLTRFTPLGLIIFSNVYTSPGDWMPREIDMGVPVPGVPPVPMPGHFVITGEMTPGPALVPQTFAAVYDGGGAELWRNLYPAGLPFPTMGDAGYDVVWDPIIGPGPGSYCVVGAVQTTAIRGAATSTPYILRITNGGAILGASTYTTLTNAPLGLYPRCVSPGSTPGQMVFAGPDFTTGRTFAGAIPPVLPPPAGIFMNYAGNATANSFPQPMVLNDAQPEDILFTNLGTLPGYLVSTNAVPGSFGGNDGHFIRTNLAFQTPDSCKEQRIPTRTFPSFLITPQIHQVVGLLAWGKINTMNYPYPVNQVFCKDTCIVSASFTFTKADSTVTFTNTSTGNGTLTYSWNFGDGSPLDPTANPVHVYNGPGPFYTCLTVTNTIAGLTCTRTFCDTVKICKVGPASFTLTQSGATLSLTGSGSGNGTLLYSWNYGDGTTGAGQTATHTYGASGTYNICLTVANIIAPGDTCRSVFCRLVTIVACTVKAGFNYSVNCKTVTFTNTTTGTGPFTYNWNFGDGTTSAVASPVKIYANCGNYTVRLIVCSQLCCDTIIKVVNVPCCTVKSAFCVTTFNRNATLNIDTAGNGAAATYTVFVNGTSTVWANNTVRVLTPGNYNVCVRVRRILCPGDTCCATSCRTFRIFDTCTLVGDFWYQTQTTGAVVFTNKSTPATAPITYAWDFGVPSITTDTSTLLNPTYTYTTPGTYNACLTVTRASGIDTCRQRICKTVVIDPPCKPRAQFQSTFCSDSILKVSFTNMSTGATSYEWDFGVPGVTTDTSTQKNPMFTFPYADTFVVCLKAIVNGNCWYQSWYNVIVSATTKNTSCVVLPANPAYRLANLVAANEMIPIGYQVNGGEIIKEEEPGKLSLFPNPASQQVQVVFETAKNENSEVWLLNAAGKTVYTRIAPVANGKNQLTIPVRNLPNGIYRVSVRTNDRVLTGNFFVDNK